MRMPFLSGKTPIALLFALCAVLALPAEAGSPSPPVAFWTINPCRLVDTRSGAPLGAGVHTFPVTGLCGIPAGTVAVSLAGVTVVEPQVSGSLAVYESGIPFPGTSVLNWNAGRTRASNTISGLSAAGTVDVSISLAGPGGVHIVLDSAGYFGDTPPTAVNDAAAVTEEDPATAIPVLVNDTDPDGGPMVITSASDPANGTVVLTGGAPGAHTGLTYQPDPNYCNTPPGTTLDTFTYTLNGGSTATVSVSVTCVDDLPAAVDDTATVGEDAAATAVAVLGNDTDPESDPFTIASASDPANGTVVLTGGSPGAHTGLTYQPDPNYCNTPPGSTLDTFTYTLNPGGSTATVSMTVTCVDDNPVAVNDTATVAEDAPATPIVVLANDTDIDGGPLSIASASDPANGTVVLTGGTPGAHTGLTYQPDPNFCSATADTFTYSLNPGGSTATVSVTVTCADDNPVAVNDSATVAEDAAATTILVLANDTDLDGGPMTIATASDPANGTVVIAGDNLSLTYQPDPNYCNNPPGTSPDTFTYSLSPGGSTATVSVTVTCANDGPVVDLNGPTPGGTDFTVTFTEGDPPVLLEDGVDPDAATIVDVDSTTLTTLTVTLTNLLDPTFEVLDANVTGFPNIAKAYTTPPGQGVLTLSTVTPQPVADFQAVLRTVTYVNTDQDPDGTARIVQFVANDGTNNGNTAVSTVTLVPVDIAPVAVADAATVNEDSGATMIDVLANDTDVDGGPKTIASATDPANGTVVIAGDNLSLTYQPDTNYCNSVSGPPDTFNYTLSPGSSSTTVSVTVTCVDDNPTAVADTATVAEDSGATMINVLANDTDPDAGPKTIASATDPANGTVVVAGDNLSLTYQPDPNYCNSVTGIPDTFNYTLSPGSSSTTVSVTVTCVDDPPVAVDDLVTVNEDSGANTLSVQANDTDIDAGPKAVATVTDPPNGTATVVAGNAVYTPDLNYCNAITAPSATPDVFTYTLTPGGDTGSVAVTVICINDPPTVVNEAFQVIGNTELRVDMVAGTTIHTSETTAGASSYEGVLDNDSDAEGDTISVTAVGSGCGDATAPFDCTLASGAVVHVDANGEFSFTPGPADTADSFQYTVTDQPPGGGAISVNGTVTFTFFEMVWYVDNSLGAAGNGTSLAPFNAITAANLSDTGADGDFTDDLDDASDYIFVDFGNGTDSGQTTGLQLEVSQHLLGEFAGLSIPVNLNGNGSPTVLVAPPSATACSGGPCRPLLSNTAGNAVTASDNDGAVAPTIGTIPVEIVGMSLQGSVNAIDLTTNTTLTGSSTLTILQNVFRGAGAEGIDANLNTGTSGALTLNIQTNSWITAGTHTGNAVDIVRTAGTLSLNFSDNLNVVSTAAAVSISGGGATTITGFANNSVHGNTGGGGILVSSATFDGTAGGAYSQVSGGTTAIGVSGNVVGGAGMSLSVVSGDLAFTDLDIFAGGGAGLSVGGTGAVNVGAGTGTRVTVGAGVAIIEATGGPAVDISSATIDLQLSNVTTLKSTNSTSTGVSLVTVGGTFNAAGGTVVTNPTGVGISVGSSAGTIGFGNTSITSSGGTGVSLTSNTAPVTFADLDISPDSGVRGMQATSNTGAITSTSGTISTTNQTAVDIVGVSAASRTPLNVQLTSVSALASGGNPPNGIVLGNTSASGSPGGFRVLGSGGTCTQATPTCSGGRLQSTSGADVGATPGATTPYPGIGVRLHDAQTVVLTRMRMDSHSNFAIRGTNVVGFTLDTSVIDGANGTSISADSDAVANGEDSVRFTNLTGSADITNCYIGGGLENIIRVINNTGTLNRLTVSGSTIGGAGAGEGANSDDAIVVSATGIATPATINFSLLNSTLLQAKGDIVQVASNQNATADVVIRGNVISNSHPTIVSGVGGLTIGASNSVGQTATLTYDISCNRMRDAKGNGLTLFKGGPGTTNMTGTVFNNRFGVTGVVGSASDDAAGIQVDAQGSGTHTVLLKDNQIRRHNFAGISMQSGDGSATMNATVIGNFVAEPGGFGFAGFYAESGALPASDTIQFNLKNGGAVVAERNNFVDGDPGNFSDVLYSKIGAGTQFNLSRSGSPSVDAGVITQANNTAPITVSFPAGITAVNTIPTLPAATDQTCSPP